MRTFLPILFFSLATMLQAQTVKTPCAFGADRVSLALCHDPKLAAQRAKIDDGYRLMETQLSPASAALVERDHRAWLRVIADYCTDKETLHRMKLSVCLEQNQTPPRFFDPVYAPSGLQNSLVRFGATAFYFRSKHILDPTNDTLKDAYTGVWQDFSGSGSFFWPQIDKADADGAAWNRMVAQRAFHDMAGMADIDRDQKPKTYEDLPSLSDLDLQAEVFSANDVLINLDITASITPYGAMHGTESRDEIAWWLKKRRAVVASDIFRPGSGWAPALRKMVASKLAHDKDISVAQPPTVDMMTDTSGWTLERQGITITFQEGDLSNRGSTPMPAETLPWGELTRYLAVGFDPQALPDAAPAKP